MNLKLVALMIIASAFLFTGCRNDDADDLEVSDAAYEIYGTRVLFGV